MTYVLVVDDEEAVRALVRDILEVSGFDVGLAVDGPSALEAAAERLPDAVVLDIMMPGISGLDVLRTWRSDAATAALPVLLLTAATDDDTTWAGWKAGADYYLPKPFDPDALVDWVERILAAESRSPGGSDDAGAPGAAGAAGAAGGAEGGGDDAPLLAEFRSLWDE